MFKLSPRRNSRSKGFKVKHALQLFLLAGVCIWLAYQVKQSHGKKAEFRQSIKDGDQIVKLGRKDLKPLVEESVNSNASEKEEEEENKPEEINNVGRGTRDDGINENDENKIEETTDDNGVSVEGEKERDTSKENENEESKEDENAQKKNEDDKAKESEESSEKETEETKEKESEEKENVETNEKESEQKEHQETKENEGEQKEHQETKEKEGEQKEKEIKEKEVEQKENEETNEKESEQKETEETKEKEGEQKDSEETKEKESEQKDNEETKEDGSEEKGTSEESQGVDDKEGEEHVETDNKENEAEEKAGDKIEQLILSDDRVRDGGEKNNEGAREEPYKADDASSSVAHETQNATANNGQDGVNESNHAKPENGSTPNSTEQEKVDAKKEDSAQHNVVLEQPTKSDVPANSEQQDSSTTASTKTENGEATKGVSTDTYSNSESVVSESQIVDSNTSTETENSSAPLATSIVQTQKFSSDTEVEGTQESTLSQKTNDNEDGGQKQQADSSNPSFQQKDATSYTDKSDAGQTVNDSAVPNNMNENANGNDNTDASQKESVDSSDSSVSQDKEESSNTNNNAEAGQNENENVLQSKTDDNAVVGQKENEGAGGEESGNAQQKESEDSSNTNENTNESQNVTVDSSHSSILEEENKARIDLETLPESKTETHTNDDTAAE